MGWRRPLLVFLAAALLVDLRYLIEVSDIVDTDKYYMGMWWIPWSYLEAAFSPYTPDYMGILKFNYHPSSILVDLLYLIVDMAGLNATTVLPFLLHLSLMVGMYILLSRLTQREELRILGSLAYAFNPVSSSYYVAVPIAFLPALLPVMVAFILDLGRKHTPTAIARAGLVAGFTVSMHYSFAPLAAIIAAITGAYTLLYSPSRSRILKAMLLASVVAFIAMLPTLAHLYVIHAISPDRQLNYLSQGLSPESVARDIRYCYNINLEGLLSLTWDPCHKQTRIVYWGNPLSLLHAPLTLTTLLLAALVPRIREAPKIIAAASSSTLLAISLFLILLLSSIGPSISDNLLVTAIRSPLKVRVLAEFSLIVGTVITIDYLLSARRFALRRPQGHLSFLLALILASSLAGITAPYIVKTFNLETYSMPSSVIEPLYHEGVITPEPRGIILPYSHEALLNSPPNMRLLPLFPRPPIVGYLDNSYDAGTLPLALEALGVGRVIITSPVKTSFYDVALTEGVNISSIAAMLASDPRYTLRYNTSNVVAYDAPWSITSSYSGVYVASKPRLVPLASYILDSEGYLPTIYPLNPVKQGLKPLEAYMLSSVYLGPSAGDYRLVSERGRLYIYSVEVNEWNSPRLSPYYRVNLDPGESVEVARGSMMTVTIGYAPEGSRLQVLSSSGQTILDISIGAGGLAECRSPEGAVSSSVISFSIVYKEGEVIAELGGARCRSEASGIVRIVLENGASETSVTVAGATYGPIYRAEAVDGWRVFVYRMGYNSLYRLHGVETLNEEPLVADGYANAWLYRGGDPVVVEPLGTPYMLLGILVWVIYYPLMLLTAAGLDVKRLYRIASSRAPRV